MPQRNTANTQSSASNHSGSPQRRQNLLSTDALRLAHKAATVHMKSDGKTMSDPYEFETVSLWEDLYHKVLLRGYSNNSQWPPYNQSRDRMDICTYYFDKVDDGFRRLPLLFTEGKRARNATSTTQGQRPIDCEKQLYEYCKNWFKAGRPRGAENKIFGNAVIGPYIRFFTLAGAPGKNSKGETIWDVTMKDFKGKVGASDEDPPILADDYLDVGNLEHQSQIRENFAIIRRKHEPEPFPSRPSTSDSNKPAQPSTPVPSDGAASSLRGSPMSGVQQGPGQGQSSRAIDGRSASPPEHDQRDPTRRERSPQNNPTKTSGGH